MVLVRFNSNPTLKGHKLYVAIPINVWPTPQERIDSIRQRFPDLEIIFHEGEGAEVLKLISDEEWKDVTILVSWIHLPTIEQAPRLSYVQLISAGANAILNDPLYKDTEITFCTANGVHGPQISEWVISTFLAFQHHIPRYLELQRQAKWERVINDTTDAVSQRVGILGYGSIGRQVARVSKALGMDVHAYNLHPKETPEARRDHGWAPPGLGDPDGIFPSKWFSGGSKEDLHEFLGSGLDLLVIALPLTDKTKHLIGHAEFDVLSKKKTFVTNIGRGPIVVTDDLIDALENEKIRGAALDVTDPEPLPDGHRLWKVKNLIITPHVSGNSVNYLDRLLSILESNLERLSEGKDLINKVNRKDGY